MPAEAENDLHLGRGELPAGASTFSRPTILVESLAWPVILAMTVFPPNWR